MSEPRVSVIVPTHNGAATLGEAVASIRAGGANVEIVIVDDGSNDQTPELIASMEGVRAVRQDNAGPAAARNAGLKLATAPRIAFLDDDDIALEGKLRILEALLDEDLTASIAIGLSAFRTCGNPPQDGEPLLMYHLGAALFRREVFDRIGAFDPRLRASEDADLFLRARDAGERFATTEKLVQFVRRTGDNMTTGKGLRELGFMEVLKRSLDRRRRGEGA